ncbi:hypothetical protein V8C86DRAFT_2491884 [Haematococcus lacustris]
MQARPGLWWLQEVVVGSVARQATHLTTRQLCYVGAALVRLQQGPTRQAGAAQVQLQEAGGRRQIQGQGEEMQNRSGVHKEGESRPDQKQRARQQDVARLQWQQQQQWQQWQQQQQQHQQQGGWAPVSLSEHLLLLHLQPRFTQPHGKAAAPPSPPPASPTAPSSPPPAASQSSLPPHPLLPPLDCVTVLRLAALLRAPQPATLLWAREVVWEQQLLPRLHLLGPQELSTVAWALAKLGRPTYPPQEQPWRLGEGQARGPLGVQEGGGGSGGLEAALPGAWGTAPPPPCPPLPAGPSSRQRGSPDPTNTRRVLLIGRGPAKGVEVSRVSGEGQELGSEQQGGGGGGGVQQPVDKRLGGLPSRTLPAPQHALLRACLLLPPGAWTDHQVVVLVCCWGRLGALLPAAWLQQALYQRPVQRLSDQALSLVVYGLGRMGAQVDGQWLAACLEEVLLRAPRLTPGMLRGLLQGLAWLGLSPGPAWLASLLQAGSRALAGMAPAQLADSYTALVDLEPQLAAVWGDNFDQLLPKGQLQAAGVEEAAGTEHEGWELLRAWPAAAAHRAEQD